MKTFASMFSGGGGADIGAIAAGLEPIWGIEYVPEIAASYAANIGHPAIVSSVLTVNYKTLTAPFWLHASPPCVTASVANSKAGESLMDNALAAAVCEAIDALLPEWFSLENVSGYRAYASYAAIKDALADNGYKMVEGVLNAADYGVPQTRRRLFLIAGRTGAPVLPRPTHTDKHEVQQLDLFAPEPLEAWAGWYEAIEDLVPSLPESKLAAWQVERLPEPLRESVLINESSTMETNVAEEPSATLVASGRSLNTRAILIHASGGDPLKVSEHNEPSHTVVSSEKTMPPKLVCGMRVVRLTPRCLFRLQGVPDSYVIPDDRRLAGRIAGNMVCPPVQAAIIKAQML